MHRFKFKNEYRFIYKTLQSRLYFAVKILSGNVFLQNYIICLFYPIILQQITKNGNNFHKKSLLFRSDFSLFQFLSEGSA